MMKAEDLTNNWPTFTAFTDDFSATFITQNEAEEAVQKLNELRQGKGTVLAYNAQFKTLVNQANLTDFTAIQEKYL